MAALTTILWQTLANAFDRSALPRALQTLRDEAETRLAALEATGTTGGAAKVASIRIDLTAGTDLAEAVLQREPLVGTITAAEFESDAAITGDDTDNVTLTVRRRDGAGGSAATVATLQTNVAGGNVTAFVSKSLGTIANAAIVAAGKVTLQVAHAGAGKALHGVLRVKYTAS